MGTKLKVQGRYVFPAQCVVCMAAADTAYTIEKVIGQGQGSSLLRIPVPMCPAHAGQANSRGLGEKVVSKLALILGIAAGLASAAWIVNYWTNTHQGNIVLNLFLAVILGTSMGLLFWAILAFYISPLFATPAVKRLRKAVKIVQYFPGSDVLELEFSNPETAAGFASVNKTNLLP
jgi:hypothetical protein